MTDILLLTKAEAKLIEKAINFYKDSFPVTTQDEINIKVSVIMLAVSVTAKANVQAEHWEKQDASKRSGQKSTD